MIWGYYYFRKHPCVEFFGCFLFFFWAYKRLNHHGLGWLGTDDVAKKHLGCPSTEPEWCGDTGWNGWNGFFFRTCHVSISLVKGLNGVNYHCNTCSAVIMSTWGKRIINRCHVETWLWRREGTKTKWFESSLQAGCIFFVQDSLLYIINFPWLFLYCTLTDLPVLFCDVFSDFNWSRPADAGFAKR